MKSNVRDVLALAITYSCLASVAHAYTVQQKWSSPYGNRNVYQYTTQGGRNIYTYRGPYFAGAVGPNGAAGITSQGKAGSINFNTGRIRKNY